jgi:precorrin-6B methylase 2
MIWLPGLVERNHDLQNPSSPEKLRTVAARIRLGPEQHVLDVGAGSCGPAVLLASEYGCRVTAVEQYEGFVERARARAEAAGVSHLVTVVHGDGSAWPRPGDVYDVGWCLGATFVYDGYEATLDRLTPAVRPGGHLVVGEVYARVPGQQHEGEALPSLDERLAVLLARGLRPVSVQTANDDEWETYHSLHLLALEDWLDENPGHEEYERILAFRADNVAALLAQRLLGWTILAARVP